MLQRTVITSQFRLILFPKKYGHLLKNRVSGGARSSFSRRRSSPYKENDRHCDPFPRSVWKETVAFPPFYTEVVFQPSPLCLAETAPLVATEGKGDLRRARRPIGFVLIVFGSSLMKSTTQGNKEISLLFAQNIECVLSKLLN